MACYAGINGIQSQALDYIHDLGSRLRDWFALTLEQRRNIARLHCFRRFLANRSVLFIGISIMAPVGIQSTDLDRVTRFSYVRAKAYRYVETYCCFPVVESVPCNSSNLWNSSLILPTVPLAPAIAQSHAPLTQKKKKQTLVDFDVVDAYLLRFFHFFSNSRFRSLYIETFVSIFFFPKLYNFFRGNNIRTAILKNQYWYEQVDTVGQTRLHPVSKKRELIAETASALARRISLQPGIR